MLSLISHQQKLTHSLIVALKVDVIWYFINSCKMIAFFLLQLGRPELQIEQIFCTSSPPFLLLQVRIYVIIAKWSPVFQFSGYRFYKNWLLPWRSRFFIYLYIYIYIAKLNSSFLPGLPTRFLERWRAVFFFYYYCYCSFSFCFHVDWNPQRSYVICWKGYLFETNVVGSFFIRLIFCNVSPSTWK